MGRNGRLVVGVAARPGSQFVAEAEPKSFGAAPSPREARGAAVLRRNQAVNRRRGEDELLVESRIREFKGWRKTARRSSESNS